MTQLALDRTSAHLIVDVSGTNTVLYFRYVVFCLIAAYRHAGCCVGKKKISRLAFSNGIDVGYEIQLIFQNSMNHATFVNMQYKYLLDAFVLWNTLNRVSSIRLNIYCNEFDSRSAYASVREAGSHHTAGAEDPNSILVSNITVE